MSRNLLRTSPWSTTDHICLGCRRRLLQQASHSLDVRRQRASTSAQASNSKPHGRPSTEAKSASKTAKLLIRKFKGPSVSAAAQAGKHKTKDLSAAQETDLVNTTQGRSITQALFKYGKTGKQEQAGVSASPAPWDVQHDWAEKPGKSSQQSSSAGSRNATGTKLDHGAPSFDQVSKKLPVFEVNVGELTVDPLDIEQPPVPPLAHGLDRVLFNPNIYLLQDPHSGVYNFDPYIEDIMPVNEFDFAALPPYKTSSEDSALTRLAAEHNARYVGSTSSMTGALCHFHFLLSHFRHLNFNMLSQEFKPESKQVTRIYRAPYSIFLRWKNGSYAIDADKEHDSPNVLMMLGKSLEKLLTLEKDDMERYRKSSPGEVTQEEREAVDAFQYTTMGNMLMRSQLDAYDPRLPGYGTFDLKTRAVLPIRHNAREFEDMLGYELKTLRGQFESYEREYYDMARATMLKYMLQARMGKMDGIFVAYHNVERIFGFQYLPMSELDRVVHGTTDPTLGDGEFKLSLKMFNHLLDMATEKFPEQSLRVVFEATGKEATPDVLMRVYAEPLTESEIHEIQSAKKKVFTAYEDRMQNGMSQKEALQQIIVEQAEELAEDEADDKSVSTEGEQIDGIEDGTAVEAQDVVADAASPAPAASPTASSTSDVTAGAPSQEDRVTKQSAAGDGSEKDAADILVAATQQAKTTQKAKAAKDAPLKPLFAVSVLVEHTVNNYTGHKRPDGLTAEDTWKVKYAIRDHAEKNLAGAWTLYRTTKQARKSAFMNIGEEDNPFYRELHRMVSSGREYREALDKAQEGTTPIIWSPSMPKSVQKQEQAT